MTDYSELKRLLFNETVLYRADNHSPEHEQADLALHRNIKCTLEEKLLEVVLKLEFAESERQRQFELRRLEWNRAEGLQVQMMDLQQQIKQLNAGAQA